MEQAARKISTWHATVGRVTRVSCSKTASKLLWSSGGSRKRKMSRVSLLRSGTRHKLWMPRSHQWYAHKLVGIVNSVRDASEFVKNQVLVD